MQQIHKSRLRGKAYFSLHLVVKTIESRGHLGNQLLAFFLCIAWRHDIFLTVLSLISGHMPSHETKWTLVEHICLKLVFFLFHFLFV